MSSDEACSALAALKMCGVKKTFKSFKDLPVGEYIIDRFTHVDTSHGRRVRVDMGNAYMYLPERYTDLSEDKINTLNKTPKIMVYDGKDPADRDRLILDFRDTQTYFADLLTNSEILNDQPQSFWIRKKNQKWFKMY